jgi:F-type H+-transporting ATPase subunit b
MAQQATTTATTSAPEHGPEHGKAFPPLDAGTFAAQLFWLAVAFGLLYALMARLALPRMRETMQQRRDRVQRDLAAAEKLKGETELALANYEQALAAARSKAHALARGVRDTLAQEVERERVAIEAEIGNRLAEAEARIHETKRRALTGVGDIAVDLAGAIVTKLLGKGVSQEEVKRALPLEAAE